MTVTYTFGEQSEVLDSATICSWITGSAEGQIQLNMDQVNAYVQALAAKYNTAGTARAFHTATGRDVSVTGPFGWKIEEDPLDGYCQIYIHGMTNSERDALENRPVS